jgi:hypothetical protein
MLPMHSAPFGIKIQADFQSRLTMAFDNDVLTGYNLIYKAILKAYLEMNNKSHICSVF